MLMDAYRCTMVTISQAAEGGKAEPGTRPHGHEATKVMKSFLARSSETHGPLPRDNPNFAVFAAPERDAGTVRVGDTIAAEHVSGDCSIWAHNRARSAEAFRLDEARFWHSEGPKPAVA